MNKETYDNQLIMDYLLGSLSSTETEHLDEISFTDDEFAERSRAVENDLVDAYVRGQLHGTTLERFKSFYLSSPSRREKVEFAENFLKLADSAMPPKLSQSVRRQPSFWRSGLAWLLPAVAASLLIAVSWLLVQDLRLRQQRDQARTESETLRQRAAELQLQSGKQEQAAAEQQKQIDELRNALARLEPRSALSEPQIVPFVLQPQTRGISRAAAISVPTGTDFVTFQLELEGETHTSYQATLRPASAGGTIWSRSGLKAQRRDGNSVVVVTSRAALINSGDYVWELSGEAPGRTPEAIGSYTFKVVKN